MGDPPQNDNQCVISFRILIENKETILFVVMDKE